MKSIKSTCAYLLVCLVICLIEQRKIKCEEETNCVENCVKNCGDPKVETPTKGVSNNACSFCYKNFLDGLDGLNGEQLALRKKQLNECNQRFFCVYDEFFLNKLGMDVFEHFREIQRKIETRRDELKKELDEIAERMKGKTEKYKLMYSNSLTSSLKSHTFNLETSSQECPDRDMEVMKLKLNLMIEFKEKLCLNKFESTLNKFEEDWFGKLSLEEFKEKEVFKKMFFYF